MATSTRAWRAAGVVLLVTSSLAGCTKAAERAQVVRHPVTQAPTPTASPTPTELPVKGGTLRVIGTGTDYLDANISYYSVGYSLLRLISRQLYTWPADPEQAPDVVPDLAVGLPQVDRTRTVYTVTIRRGARWETSPPRQVTAADVVRGVEITCNPAQPFGGLSDFESLISGMEEFCQGFSRLRPRVSAIRNYLDRQSISGVHVGANRLQVVFELTRPANYFPDLLALPAFSPRPREMLAELPGGDRGVSHPISDGPYRLASQIPSDYGAPAHLTFTRNPAWDPSTDPVRKAYVDKVDVDFRADVSDPHKALRRLRSGDADLCYCFIGQPDAGPLLRRHDARLTVHPSYAINPYLVFNTVSPNNGGALRNPDVRRAISYALDRSAFIRALGGPQLAPALAHILPDGVLGSESFDPYPHDVDKAKQLLDKAGVTRLVLWGSFRFSSPAGRKIFASARAQLAQVGVRLRPRVAEEDYFDMGLGHPQNARRGNWDIALSGWLPDWDGNAAVSFFRSLFDGRMLPPSSSNFGLYDDPKLNQLIDQASQADLRTAATLWHRADALVMSDAAVYPIAQRSMVMWCGDRVGNCRYVPELDGVDLTQVWRRLSR
jgi:peptide/nickel transport system substrate-binding protein